MLRAGREEEFSVNFLFSVPEIYLRQKNRKINDCDVLTLSMFSVTTEEVRSSD